MTTRSWLLFALLLAVGTYVYYGIVFNVSVLVFFEPHGLGALNARLAMCAFAAFVGLVVGPLLTAWTPLRKWLAFAGAGVPVLGLGWALRAPLLGLLLAVCLILNIQKGRDMTIWLDPDAADYDVIRRRAEIRMTVVIIAEFVVLILGLAWCG